MKRSVLKKSFISIFCSFFILPLSSFAHDILFCGESIPVSSNFVADKLMNVIRRQIPNVNMLQLRKRVELYFPTIEYYLHATHLPEDLKYIAIVESGFQNLSSQVGARGFWQLMPGTASEKGLIISEDFDERDNFRKSTYAACKVLAEYYLRIRKNYGISSWVLTAAAYNVGIGNMLKAINKQGKDYFSMNLNQETSMYVYKIIAIKELFEYPELYMKDFNYNVFNAIPAGIPEILKNADRDTLVFNSMQVNVKEDDGAHPVELVVTEPEKPTEDNLIQINQPILNKSEFKYLSANISGKYKNFKDGQLITIQLQENLEVKGSFSRKGNLLKGKGWIIGDRIFIDLGYGNHDVTLLDINGKKGVFISSLKKNEPLLLKVQNDF
ncbi:MAG TPA: lytic transglycosylase domain-containing protein [Panacibacter sp.]|nr:lytic transglycosylase domain-containing protein [Panacibacter sp.]